MGDTKYRAFVSYSHADEQWGGWLQRSLEQFRAPKELARAIEAAGRPLRLTPVFRDREDLPVAGNLNDAIQKALAESEFQIVLCSPNAAKSRWVNEEIKLFNRLHGPGRTFAIIIAGEPGGGEQECFPPALRFKLDRNGEPTAEPAEPLAADAREGGDGKRYALLKTAAGMLGVGLDDLVRRDAQRRARRARAIAGGASLITGVMAFVTAYAIRQRDEARTARGEAEELVEFMLSDLSDKLEPVGKLDIIEDVGGKVLDYYDGQDLKSLDAEALSRRARGLMQLGNVDQRRGDLNAALSAFQAAFESTEENLRRAPNDPNRIFDHAQSVFYVGNIAVVRGDFDVGAARFEEYFEMAQNLVRFDEKNPKWRLEVSYAATNLGAIKYNRGEYAKSIPFFTESAEARRVLASEAPGDRAVAFAYASALSWLAYAQLATGDFPAAISVLEKQLAVYREFDDGAVDYESMEKRITAERRVAQAQIALGELDAAEAALARAAALGDLLLAREPENQNSLANVSITARMVSYVSGLKGDKRVEREQARQALEIARAVARRDPSPLSNKMNLGWALCRLLTAEAPGSESDVQTLEGLVSDKALQRDSGEALDLTIAAGLVLAQRHRLSGEDDRATAAVAETVAAIRARSTTLSAGSQLSFAMLLREAGDLAGAGKLAESLYSRGVRHPELIALRAQLKGG